MKHLIKRLERIEEVICPRPEGEMSPALKAAIERITSRQSSKEPPEAEDAGGKDG